MTKRIACQGYAWTSGSVNDSWCNALFPRDNHPIQIRKTPYSNPGSCCTFKKQPWLYTHWYSCVRYWNYFLRVSRRKLIKHSIMFVALCREKSTARFGIGKVSRAKSWSVSNSNNPTLKALRKEDMLANSKVPFVYKDVNRSTFVKITHQKLTFS